MHDGLVFGAKLHRAMQKLCKPQGVTSFGKIVLFYCFFFRKINVYFSVEIYCKQSFETIHGGMLWCPICVKKRRHHISGAARPLCVWPPFASRTGLGELSEWDMIMLLAAIGQCSCKFKVI